MTDSAKQEVLELSKFIKGDKEYLQSQLDELQIRLKLRDLETQLLLVYVQAVVDENDCRCGEPPFTDGNQCSVCFGLNLLGQFKNFHPAVELPLSSTKMIVDLDRLVNFFHYLDRLNDVPFDQMVFVKDGQQVELMKETLEVWAKVGLSKVEILKKVYGQVWGHDS